MTGMSEFTRAALPWLLCGIAIAILCARMRQGTAAGQEKALQTRMALGMSLGLMMGAAWNSMGLWDNHGLGLALGPLWGMALATLFQDEEGHNEK